MLPTGSCGSSSADPRADAGGDRPMAPNGFNPNNGRILTRQTPHEGRFVIFYHPSP